MKRSLVVFSLMAMSSLAFAEGFSYTYLQASYGTVDLDNTSVDGDGFGVDFSYGITDNLHAVANYQTADFDLGFDGNRWSLGIGVHTPINENFDVVAAVSYVDEKFEVPLAPDLNDDGFALDVGIRANVMSKIEVNAGITYVDLSSQGDSVAFGGGALYNFTDMFSAGLSAKWGEMLGVDTATYTLIGRINFGK